MQNRAAKSTSMHLLAMQLVSTTSRPGSCMGGSRAGQQRHHKEQEFRTSYLLLWPCTSNAARTHMLPQAQHSSRPAHQEAARGTGGRRSALKRARDFPGHPLGVEARSPASERRDRRPWPRPTAVRRCRQTDLSKSAACLHAAGGGK
jgi:hypothetical protein